jgi:hypothetical protein
MNLKITDILLLTILLLNIGCSKDKVPLPEPPPELTKYEKIVGTYNVYDTIGNFLYKINLGHSDSLFDNGTLIDSIHYYGFEGQFNFSESQGTPYYPVNYFLYIGYHGPLYDTLNKRWKIIGHYDPNGIYDNTFHDDTIRMIYRKININYWIEDATPYKDTIVKIVAIKQ